MNQTRLLPLIGIIVILSGCSVERRIYTRGINLSWGENFSGHTKQKRERKPLIKPATTPELKSTLTASNKNGTPATQDDNGYALRKLPKDTCDIIELKNEKYISAKIMELNPDYIVFKKCGDAKGRNYKIPVSKLSKIIFADSSLQPIIFQEGQPVPKRVTDDASDGSDDNTKVRYRYVRHSESFGGFSILAFLIACLAGYVLSIWFPVTIGGILLWLLLCDIAIAAAVVSFVFAILAIAYALKSLKRIYKSPKIFTGEEEAYTGLSRGITIFTLLLIAGLCALYFNLYLK